MTFGYYSNPGGSSQDNLYTLSKNLLGKLANERACTVGQLAGLPWAQSLLTYKIAESAYHLRCP